MKVETLNLIHNKRFTEGLNPGFKSSLKIRERIVLDLQRSALTQYMVNRKLDPHNANQRMELAEYYGAALDDLTRKHLYVVVCYLKEPMPDDLFEEILEKKCRALQRLERIRSSKELKNKLAS